VAGFSIAVAIAMLLPGLSASAARVSSHAAVPANLCSLSFGTSIRPIEFATSTHLTCTRAATQAFSAAGTGTEAIRRKATWTASGLGVSLLADARSSATFIASSKTTYLQFAHPNSRPVALGIWARENTNNYSGLNFDSSATVYVVSGSIILRLSASSNAASQAVALRALSVMGKSLLEDV
jgi:hypothetical protein